MLGAPTCRPPPSPRPGGVSLVHASVITCLGAPQAGRALLCWWRSQTTRHAASAGEQSRVTRQRGSRGVGAALQKGLWESLREEVHGSPNLNVEEEPAM